MSKTILITGSTDGIGLETAKMCSAAGHQVILHGRSQAKLKTAMEELAQTSPNGEIPGYQADLSKLSEIMDLSSQIKQDFDHLDVLINNAGVYKTPNPIAENGLDIRFMVNTVAPSVLTKELLPLLGRDGRVISLSSAAQASVNLQALTGQQRVSDMDAYAQSKLALTMWSAEMARAHSDGPVFIAVNPGSLLASKMVKEGFGVAGNDIRIGADILMRLSLDPEFENASGKYFDNDRGQFGPPHANASDPQLAAQVMGTLEKVVSSL